MTPLGQTEITISMRAGQADVLVVATQSELDLTRYCFRCHSHWAGRLLTQGRASWATQVPGRDFRSDPRLQPTFKILMCSGCT